MTGWERKGEGVEGGGEGRKVDAPVRPRTRVTFTSLTGILAASMASFHLRLGWVAGWCGVGFGCLWLFCGQSACRSQMRTGSCRGCERVCVRGGGKIFEIDRLSSVKCVAVCSGISGRSGHVNAGLVGQGN